MNLKAVFPFVFVIALISGCENADVPQKVSSSFQSQQKELEFIRHFFESNEYEIDEITFYNGKWNTKGQDYKLYLQHANKPAGNDITTLLSYFEKLNVHGVEGNESFLTIHFNHGHMNCYVMYYGNRHLPDSLMIINKVYMNEKKEGFWNIRLDSNWFARRVSCI